MIERKNIERENKTKIESEKEKDIEGGKESHFKTVTSDIELLR